MDITPTKKNSGMEITLEVPPTFSIMDNPDKTLKFFTNLINEIKSEDYRFIKFNYKNVQKVTTCSNIYLMSLIHNLQVHGKFPRCIHPKIKNVENILNEIGCLVNSGYTTPSVKNKKNYNLLISMGNKFNGKTIQQVVDMLIIQWKVDRNDLSFIFDMIAELMQNTEDHAYNSAESNKFPGQKAKKWYLYVKLEDDKKATFAFLDNGDGIPATVKKRKREKLLDYLFSRINKILTKTTPIDKSCDYIISALKGENRSNGRPYNKDNKSGLPIIYEFFENKKISKFNIFSNFGCCKLGENINPKKPQKATFSYPVKGTMFLWECDLATIS
jgi:hypothetical protein